MTYESGYGARGRISAAQRLAELACERSATRGGGSLADRFWEHERWEREFRTQVRLAAALLKLYEPEAVMAGFREAHWMCSLGIGDLRPIVARHQRQLDGLRFAPRDPIAE